MTNGFEAMLIAIVFAWSGWAAAGSLPPGCVPPQFAPQGPTSSVLPDYFWPDAEYQAYQAWLHQTLPSGWQIIENFDLDKILFDLGLGPVDLGRMNGRVLLAGEACLGPGGLFAALRSTRGGSSKDLVALDLAYRGRSEVVVEGTVTRMPFADASFDHVLSHMVAHYLRSHDQLSLSPLKQNQQLDFVREVLRVLRPGGEARIGLFITQDPSRANAIDEVAPIRASISSIAHVETIEVRPGFTALVLRKPGAMH